MFGEARQDTDGPAKIGDRSRAEVVPFRPVAADRLHYTLLVRTSECCVLRTYLLTCIICLQHVRACTTSTSSLEAVRPSAIIIDERQNDL